MAAIRISLVVLTFLIIFPFAGFGSQTNDDHLLNSYRKHLLSPCPYSFEGDKLIENYLKATKTSDTKEIHRRLGRIYTQLRCVDGRAFQRLHDAFATSLEDLKTITPEFRQRMAPLVIIFHEVGGVTVDTRLLEWLRKNAEALLKDFEDPKSLVSRIGVYAGYDEYVVEVSRQNALRLFASYQTPVWNSGKCTIRKMIKLNDGRLFCPDDCVSDFLADLHTEDPAQSRAGILAAFVSDELKEICKDFRNSINENAGLRKALLSCIQDFVDREDVTGLGCIVQKAKGRRNPLELFETKFQPQVEIRFPRQCWLSQGDGNASDNEPPSNLTEEEKNRLRELDEKEEELRREEEGWREADEAVREVEEGRDPGPRRVGSEQRILECKATAEGCSAPVKLKEIPVSEARERVNKGTGENLNEQRRVQAERERIYEQARQRNSTGQCPPDAPTCNDQCGIQNELVQDAAECLQTSQPDRPMTPRGPQPDPSPLGPGPMPEAYKSLGACINTVAKSYEPATQNDCSACLRCANGEIPRGENCTCTTEQRAADPEPQCMSVIQCDPQRNTCECSDRIQEVEGGSSGPFPPDPEVFLEVRLGGCG